MNSRYQNPEVIGVVSTIDENGDESDREDVVVGFGLDKEWLAPVVLIDLRGALQNANVMVRIELTELVQAIALATARNS